MLLANRLADGLRIAEQQTIRKQLTPSDIRWSSLPVALPLARHLNEEDVLRKLKETPPKGTISYADQLAFLRRMQQGHKIAISCLSIGEARVLHMPGELFVEYQLAAKAMRQDLHVMMAAYGDYGPGYIGTEQAYSEGGYETQPTSSSVDPSVEPLLLDTLEQLLNP
jgi:hypothetical protein